MRRPLHATLAAAALVATAVAAVGCGVEPPKGAGDTGSLAGTTSTTAGTSSTFGGSTIAGPSCLELGKAVEAITTSADETRADDAVTAIEAYDPPAEVSEALTTLRAEVGSATADPAAAEAATTLYTWLGAVCP